MGRRKRRKFTPEYKAEVVKLVRTSGKSIGQVSSELELTETAVRAWVKRAEIDEKQDPNGAADERGTRRKYAAAARVADGDNGTGLPPKSCSLLRQERKMSFELIAAEEAHYPKALMCRALGLSRSGHHSFRTRGPSRRALGQQQLDLLVAAIFIELKARYGAPRIEKELRRRGHRTSKKRGGSIDGAPRSCFKAKTTLADDDGLASQRTHRAQPPSARLLGLRAGSRLGSPTRRTCR